MKTVLIKILIYAILVILAVNFGAASVNTPALFVTMRLFHVDVLTARLVTVAVMCAGMALVLVWALRRKFYRARVVTFSACYVVSLALILALRLAG